MQPGAEYSGQVEGEEIIRRSLFKIRKWTGNIQKQKGRVTVKESHGYAILKLLHAKYIKRKVSQTSS